MKPRSTRPCDKPFACLKERIDRKAIHLPEVHLPTPPPENVTNAEDRALFRQAMADVTPLKQKGRLAVRKPIPAQRGVPTEDGDGDAVRQLKRLVETGEGFVIRQTAEYLEGSTAGLPPEICRRLHDGVFSIQDHVDLHGLGVDAAKSAFDGFMKRSVGLGLRAVLIVHGRGRRSPGPPVLKRNLVEWLTRGSWKKWVIAFTSARACDGGAGATYLLLRKKAKTG